MVLKRILTISAALVVSCTMVWGQETLTLSDCRQRALEANRGLKQAQARREQSAALQKVALWQMLPKVSANGGYMWMEKSVKLLSDEQKERLSHIGDDLQADISEAIHSELSDLNIGPVTIGDALANRFDAAMTSADLSGKVNAMGNEIIDGLTTDTRNTGVAAVTLTQPLYMGGKLAAAYRTARLAAHLSGVQYDQKREATLVAVDEAYWQVVSVKHKQRLAQRYAALLDTLERNVQLAVEAEMATKGDLAKVRVKRNEAQMSLAKATNGLALAKMLLAERCGMPLDSRFDVGDGQDMMASGRPEAKDSTTTTAGIERRAEMKMLRIADSIAREGVRIAASTLQPNIVLTGGYLMSNPNVFNGFSNEWGGTWMAGVAVNVPLIHPGGIYAIKAAKAKRREVQYQMEEAREMINLQVEKLRFELEVAYKKLAQAESNMEQAEENLRLADESFKAGMCSSSDLMAAQTAWMQAEGEVIDARIEIEMDKVYLRQAEGES